MKSKIKHIALLALLSISSMYAQDVTTVRATSGDISDNLDLRAVASVFGDSRDLEDFERKLNDPDLQISNLDLNGDNRVDYLRVIEVTENNTHLIIVQSVLGLDTFQDVATIEVERDRNNNVQVQVVGDVYMYGANYIYEPIYISRPIIFDIFWLSSYRPYYSPWYWGYYPTYYTYWAPCNYYRYRNHIHTHVINHRHTYHYTDTRRSSRAVALYNSRRSNAYERQHPNRSFNSRNSVANRYELEQSRAGSRTRAEGTTATRSSFTNASRTNNVRSSNINTARRSDVTRSSQTTRQNTASPSRRSQSVRNDAPARRNNSDAVRTAPSSNRSSAQPARQSRNVERTAPQVRNTPSRNSSISTPRSTPSIRTAPSSPSRSAAPARSSGGSRSGGGRSRS